MPSANDGVYWDHYYPHLAGGQPQYNSQPQARQQRMLQMKLTEIAMNRFEWTGFPEEVQLHNNRWLEKCLFETALAVFYHDDEWEKDLIMRAAPAGVWDMIGNPTRFLAYGSTYYNKWLEAKECVPIWSNYMRFPDFDIVLIYSEVLAEMDRTIRINSLNSRRTKVIRMSEKTKLSIDNLQRQVDEGKSFIKVLSDMPTLAETMEVLDMGIDPRISMLDISMLRSRIWGECMTLLGINNNQGSDKKERLVASEVGGNDDQISAIRATNLQSRQTAAKQIKAMFGYDVKVEYVTDMNAESDNSGDLSARQRDAAPNSEVTK